METSETKKEKKLSRHCIQRHLKRIYRHSSHDIANCTDLNCITCSKSYICNLSGRDLTDPQLLLLSKDLSFIPTARDTNHFELLRDFDKFANRIRQLLRPKLSKSRGKNFPLKRIQKYDTKRTYFSSAKLEGVLETIKVDITKIPITDNIPHNLSRNERKAFRDLKCNSDLVINKADKGSTIVVQDKSDYIKIGLEHLNDPHTYKVLDGNPTSNICNGINLLLIDFYKRGLLDKDMVAFCSPPNKVRPARFYFLRKIHKSPIGIRPIVSSCGSPTENISQFIDYWLQPHMKSLPSYIKDTTQLINELRELSVELDTYLVTIDVKSLYTCIPHLEGIQACTEALQKSKENNPSQPNTDVLACLLELVLKNNLFEFDGVYYKQLQGTAMGTKLAPAYANIFMGQLEHNILSHISLKPSFYKRFIDDILILWPHSEADLKTFLASLNDFHPSIKFTYKYNKNRITFLDLDIIKDLIFPPPIN